MDDNYNTTKNPPENQTLTNNNQNSEPLRPDASQSSDSKESSTPEQVSQPVFETVPVEDNLQPEEIAPEVESAAPETVKQAEAMPPVPPPLETDNRTKFVIIGSAVVFFVVILFILFRLIFGTNPKLAQVKLTYWGLWEEKEVFDPLIKAYQLTNPNITIDYQKMEREEYRDRLLARAIKGTGPDIFRFHNTWVPQLRDILAPLPEKIMPRADFEKTFYKIHQTDLKVGNYYYGLPLMIDGLVLICNDGLLKKAGINKPPANWDELTEAVMQLTVKDQSGILITAGIALGITTNVEHFSDIFGLMLVQNGGDIKNLISNEAVGALESYRKFAEPPYEYWTDEMPNSIIAFIQEKVAMIIAPSWQLLTIRNANPDLKIKVVPVPIVPGGKPISIATYWVEGVSKHSKNQLEAWKFLRFLVEKDNLAKLYELETRLRPFGEPYPRIDMASLLVQDENVGAVISQADSFVSLPLASRTFDNGLNDEIIKYLENAINATTQGISYKEALETAEKGVDQVFKKYKID